MNTMPGGATLIDAWAEQILELGAAHRWVQIFENKGAIMGCSNPHPHNQIWSTTRIPVEPEKELRSQSIYLEEHGACRLCPAR